MLRHLDALPCLPATRNLLTQSATVSDGLVEWNTGILVELSLWGSEKEDDGPRYEEELAMQRAQRRNKGYRPDSPPRFSNNNSIPSMVDILEGIAAFSSVNKALMDSHSRLHNFTKKEKETSKHHGVHPLQGFTDELC